jgi:hypothetical protein
MLKKSRKSASRREEGPKRLNPTCPKSKSQRKRQRNFLAKKENYKINLKVQPKRPLTSTEKMIMKTLRANPDKIEHLNVHKMKTIFENFKIEKVSY